MARTPIKRENVKPEGDDESVENEQAPAEDDDKVAPEVKNDANLERAETVIPQKPPSPVAPAPVAAKSSEDVPEAAPPRAHVAQKFQVRSSPGRIVYAGQVMQLPPGKIIDSRSVSPEILRQQGVVLVPVDG